MKKEKVPVYVSESVFRDYLFENYMGKLPQEMIVGLLKTQMETPMLVQLADGLWQLPFELEYEGPEDFKIKLTDADSLILRHTGTISSAEEDCEDCLPWDNEAPLQGLPEDEDYDEDMLESLRLHGSPVDLEPEEEDEVGEPWIPME
jgi:hypothetical protein